MKRLAENQVVFLTVCILLMVLISIWFYLFKDVVNDDAFITYRYSQNLIHGRGFVFNPGERVLGTTAPLHALVLGIMGFFHPDIPFNGLLLSWFSLSGICITILLAFKKLKLFDIGLLSSLLIIFSGSPYNNFPLETLFLTFLLMGVFYAYVVDNASLLIIFGFLAILIRIDSVFFLSAVYFSLLLSGKKLTQLIKCGFLTLLLTLPWFIFSWSYFGSPFPNTASTKTGWSGHEWYFIQHIWDRSLIGLFSQPWLSILGLCVGCYGIFVAFSRKVFKKVRFLALWLFLYILGYSVMRIFFPHYWYYFPINIVERIFFSIGIIEGMRILSRNISKLPVRNFRFEEPRIFYGILTLAMILLLIPVSLKMYASTKNLRANFYIGGRDYLYRKISTWLTENPTQCQTIAVYEPGTLAY